MTLTQELVRGKKILTAWDIETPPFQYGFLRSLGSVLWRHFRGEYYTSLCVRRGRGALNGSVLVLVTGIFTLVIACALL